MSFTTEREKQNRMSFLDIAIIRENKTFTTSVYRKFMDNTHVAKETTLTVEKKPLVLVLPYLGSIFL